MKIELLQQRTAEDLRVIVLALKMEEFNIDDEEVKNEVYDRIKRLPSPETVNVLSASADSVRDLENNIGYILDLIDRNDARDVDYKIRYKARTGLYPRHKVLDYKSIANAKSEEIKMKREAVGFVRELVRVSSVVDTGGRGKLSSDLIVIAKAIKDDNATGDTVNRFNGAVESLRTAGFDSDADALLKEAGLWSGIKGLGKDIGQGAKDIATNQYQKARGSYQINSLKGTFKNIGDSIAKALDYAQKVQENAVNPRYQQQSATIVEQLTQMKQLNADAYNTVAEEEAEASGTPEATGDWSEAEQPAAEQPAAFQQGQQVTWDAKGRPQKGTIVGVDPSNPANTMVQIGNYPPHPVNTEGLRQACERYRMSKQG